MPQEPEREAELRIALSFVDLPELVEHSQLGLDVRNAAESYLDGETTEDELREAIRLYDAWWRDGGDAEDA